MVLLKGFGPDGLSLLHQPRVGEGGASSRPYPRAALVLYWRELDRQVRVRGRGRAASRGRLRRVLRQPPARLADRRLGVARRASRWPTAPSSTTRVARGRGSGSRAARSRGPRFWGGFLLRPDEIEFWQGQAAGCTTASATREARRRLEARAPGALSRAGAVSRAAARRARANASSSSRSSKWSSARIPRRAARTRTPVPSADSSASSARRTPPPGRGGGRPSPALAPPPWRGARSPAPTSRWRPPRGRACGGPRCRGPGGSPGRGPR